MTLRKSFVPFFRLCSVRLPIEILFAVRKFAKSQYNISFIELACSVCIGKILVSFFIFLESINFQKKRERASSITYTLLLLVRPRVKG